MASDERMVNNGEVFCLFLCHSSSSVLPLLCLTSPSSVLPAFVCFRFSLCRTCFSLPPLIIISHFDQLSVSPPFNTCSSSSSVALWTELVARGFKPSRAKPHFHQINRVPFGPQPKSITLPSEVTLDPGMNPFFCFVKTHLFKFVVISQAEGCDAVESHCFIQRVFLFCILQSLFNKRGGRHNGTTCENNAMRLHHKLLINTSPKGFQQNVSRKAMKEAFKYCQRIHLVWTTIVQEFPWQSIQWWFPIFQYGPKW